MNDELIKSVGDKWYGKHGIRQISLVRNKMRELGRFLLSLRIKSPELYTLRDALCCCNFDNIIHTVNELCELQLDTGDNADIPFHTHGKPTLALALGHSIRKAWGEAIRIDDQYTKKECENFLQLMDSEWTDRISSHALRTKKTEAAKKGDSIPLTEDLVALKIYLDQEIQKSRLALQKSKANTTEYVHLSELLSSRILLFNRRRAKEGSNITVANFQRI